MRMRMRRASKDLVTMVMIQARIYHTWFVLAVLYLRPVLYFFCPSLTVCHHSILPVSAPLALGHTFLMS
jgi:hypothetical protein